VLVFPLSVLSSLRPAVPVIVLTKLPYPNVHEMVLHNGAQGCLVKQRTSDLHSTIQRAVASIAGSRKREADRRELV